MYKLAFFNFLRHFLSLDEGTETRKIFLDITKAFDKVLHKWILCKLHQYSFTGKLLTLLIEIHSNKKQILDLNEKHSSWADIKIFVKIPF